MNKVLYTPGPTNVPEDIRKELAKDMIHHRTADFEEIFVGMLILERVYNDKEKSKTNTEYIFMVFTYCSTGKCFCTAVLQEAR